MTYFTQRIQVQNKALNFLFNKGATGDKKRYCVSTVDSHGIAHIFFMQELENKWVLDQTDQYPEWAKDVEEELSNLIKKRNYI